jgi:uncharacterized protein (TIGR00255 family)
MKSMTGYGKGQGAVGAVKLTVEIRSVNHRYSDISVKSPRSMLHLEAEIKKRVGERLKRGKIDVFINQDFTSGPGSVPVLNQSLTAAYIDLFEKIRSEFPVTGDITLSLLVAQRDVITVKEVEFVENDVRLALDEALEQALDSVERMKSVEGEATRQDIVSRLASGQELLERVEARAPQIPFEWKGRLLERLQRLGHDFEYDPQRVAQEIAIFADRCDISEEIVRFRSHLQQFHQLLDQAEPVGRQIDFLVQELNRETNTMGSKSNDADLTRIVVNLKAELEKIREQVQNIE